MVETYDWEADVVRLKAEDESRTSQDIAEIVGKHAGTVRKVLKRRAGEVDAARAAASNGHQTTVEDQIAAMGDRIVWTGENRQEVAMFLGRGENGTIYASRIDLPTLEAGTFVQARPGDTIVRVAENAYDVEHAEDDPDHPGWAGKDEFTAEAGEAVGDMPKDPEPDPLGSEVRVRGTRQLAIDFGPFAQLPTGGTLVLKSERMASGHFGMGDIVSGTFTARITDVGAKERFDKDTEGYEAKPTAYVATITEVVFDR